MIVLFVMSGSFPRSSKSTSQETLIKRGGIPYSIVHATQFFEFIKRIADEATDGTMVRLPPILIQPIVADDVAKALGKSPWVRR